MSFLPVNQSDMRRLNWDGVDFAYVCGDAYVDHPSFGAAIISRYLQSLGYRVGIISQPDYKNPESIAVFGEPKLGFLVSAGNMDSMVNHYSVSKTRREKDSYSPAGVTGLRPDRAVTVYSNLIRQKYKNAAIIIGGIEASLRRMAHYDYWSNSLRRSVLLDSGADILSYGMGEKSIAEIAAALKSGVKRDQLSFIKGTVYKTKSIENIPDLIVLPDYSALLVDKNAYAKSFMEQCKNNDYFSGRSMAEKYDDFYAVQNPPQPPLNQEEMDFIYSLPYMRDYHPMYASKGGIPAIEEVKFSITSVRGCFGSCNFCALSFHQGRIIQPRSHQSILREAEIISLMPDFKGYIHDVGGPTANFRHPACKKQKKEGACKNNLCLFPAPCKNLEVSHDDYLLLLAKLRKIPGVKKVFIRSGIRFDYLMADRNSSNSSNSSKPSKSGDFLGELCAHHVSGQLKVAPEHVSDNVLYYMGKPKNAVYEGFVRAYKKTNDALNKNQFLVPYFMSSHPGSTLKDAIALSEYLRDNRVTPQQVQDFYPTPSTISTCMYFTRVDPRTGKHVYVADSPREKAMQRALIQYKNPKNHALIKDALILANRKDLIGFTSKCLIRPITQSKPVKKTNNPVTPPKKPSGKK